MAGSNAKNQSSVVHLIAPAHPSPSHFALNTSVNSRRVAHETTSKFKESESPNSKKIFESSLNQNLIDQQGIINDHIQSAITEQVTKQARRKAKRSMRRAKKEVTAYTTNANDPMRDFDLDNLEDFRQEDIESRNPDDQYQRYTFNNM
mmetsp:Transcript_18385/g.31428  ORF Transcript_18385/g.31428 Transcript_18385/m.31428 type:complete len:148 (+) Transcript_18385:747-1190(+)